MASISIAVIKLIKLPQTINESGLDRTIHRTPRNGSASTIPK